MADHSFGSNCCGEEHETPFCPHCGSPLIPDVIVTLAKIRKHIHNNLDMANRRLEVLTPGEHEEPSRLVARKYKLASNTAHKYETWVKALGLAITFIKEAKS